MMLQCLKISIRAFTHSRDGAVAIIVAVALPVVLGFAILAIDYSVGLLTRVENQRTADIAVYAAAKTYGRISSDDQNPLAAAAAEAAHMLDLNGVDPDNLTLNLLPEDGQESPRLELLIDQDLPPIGLISLRGPDGLRVVVRSVAQVGVAPPAIPVCALATGTSGSPQFSFTGSSTLNFEGCSVGSNTGFNLASNINIDGCLSPAGTPRVGCPTSDNAQVETNPLGISWTEAQAICSAAGRSSTDLGSFLSRRTGVAERPLPSGPHCIRQSGQTSFSGNQRITDNGAGVTLFFEPGVTITTRGNFTIQLTPAASIIRTDGKAVRNVVLYGPEATLDAAGTISFNSVGCFGITMQTIDFGGNASITSARDDCNPERDLGVRSDAVIRLLE